MGPIAPLARGNPRPIALGEQGRGVEDLVPGAAGLTGSKADAEVDHTEVGTAVLGDALIPTSHITACIPGHRTAASLDRAEPSISPAIRAAVASRAAPASADVSARRMRPSL